MRVFQYLERNPGYPGSPDDKEQINEIKENINELRTHKRSSGKMQCEKRIMVIPADWLYCIKDW